MRIVAVSAAILLLRFALTSAYPTFQDEIPNGQRVPNPCDRSAIWQGVGHEDHHGGGPRNKFGLDFYSAGKKWTTELCRKDSDGDGKTNGEELGDPKCVWTKGATPAITDSNQLQHPGVCEPLNSPSCAVTNSFLTECDALGLTTPSSSSWCPSITNSHVKTETLRFNKATVSADETVYMCQQFDLPADQDYQLIAWEPIVDNRRILHHMVVYACDWGQNETLAKTPMYTPSSCRMTPPCATMIVVWAYGISGQCYPNDVGAPFGKSHYQTVILQMHYNNEDHTPGHIDSSGIKLYYTDVIRPKNKGLIAFGEMFLRVPPKTRFYQTSSSCTKKMLQPYDQYYLISMLIHIHRQGVFTQVILDKKKAGYKIMILNDTFTYDRPKVAHWEPPYEILMEPGDEFSISCGYNTLDKDEWSFFGSQTADEMCYAFMDVYTRPLGTNFMMPANMGADFDTCEQYPPNAPRWQARGCDFYAYYAKMGLELGVPAENSNATVEVLNACACQGKENYPAKSCSSACYWAMKKHNLLCEMCASDDAVWQVAMRPFYDNSEILHRAQSQMSLCQQLTSPPQSAQVCSALPMPEPRDDKGAAMQNAASITLITLTAVAMVIIRNCLW